MKLRSLISAYVLMYRDHSVHTKNNVIYKSPLPLTLQWRHNERDVVSNHQPRDCLFNHLLRRKSKKTGEFAAQRASNAKNVSIWWRQHERAVNIEQCWFICLCTVYVIYPSYVTGPTWGPPGADVTCRPHKPCYKGLLTLDLGVG